MKYQINNTLGLLENKTNPKLIKYLKEACCQGLEQKVFAGVAAAVSIGSGTTWQRGLFSAGKTRLDGFGKIVNHETYFDLASLTKPLCTTLCLLSLLDGKKLSLTDTLDNFFSIPPSSEKSNVNIGHLLSHASGLPTYLPYYKQFDPVRQKNCKKILIDNIIKEPLEYATGTQCAYSDLGFILLGDIIEQLSGMGLDHYYASAITDPLELSEGLIFLPERKEMDVDKANIAATENCPWRKTVIQGQVHDEHCWLMGGVAGHAGLFGKVKSVLILCEHILNQYKKRDSHPGYSNGLLHKSLTRQYRGKTWGLGFDTPTTGQSSSGKYFTDLSFGHLGFAGTSFWVDPQCDLVMVLLTNRVHPSRENIKIRSFRPYFHNLIREGIGLV